MKKLDHRSASTFVDSTGGRIPSTLSTDRTFASETAASAIEPGTTKVGPLAPGQRWSVARKRDVVLRLLRGENLDRFIVRSEGRIGL